MFCCLALLLLTADRCLSTRSERFLICVATLSVELTFGCSLLSDFSFCEVFRPGLLPVGSLC